MICPYCQSGIKADAETIACNLCGVTHHLECWQENKGCTTYGCANNTHAATQTRDVGGLTPREIEREIEEDEIPKIECPNCGEDIDEDSEFCKYCGVNINGVEEDEREQTGLAPYTNTAIYEVPPARQYAPPPPQQQEVKKKSWGCVGWTVTVIGVLALTVLMCKLSIDYFSDKYFGSSAEIETMVTEWNTAWQSKNMESYRYYLTNDYQYFGRDGRTIKREQRLREIQQSFKDCPNISIEIRDFKVYDDPASENDLKVTYTQIYRCGNKTDEGIKTLRVYRGDETGGEWKIYREFLD